MATFGAHKSHQSILVYLSTLISRAVEFIVRRVGDRFASLRPRIKEDDPFNVVCVSVAATKDGNFTRGHRRHNEIPSWRQLSLRGLYQLPGGFAAANPKHLD